MEFLAPVLDLKNLSRGKNSLDPQDPKDLATKDYVDGSNQTVSTATHTVGDETFLRGFGTVAIAVTIPATRTRPLVIKHVGTQDMTITLTGGQIDGNANIQLRGGKKQSVTLYFEGGNAWVC